MLKKKETKYSCLSVKKLRPDVPKRIRVKCELLIIGVLATGSILALIRADLYALNCDHWQVPTQFLLRDLKTFLQPVRYILLIYLLLCKWFLHKKIIFFLILISCRTKWLIILGYIDVNEKTFCNLYVMIDVAWMYDLSYYTFNIYSDHSVMPLFYSSYKYIFPCTGSMCIVKDCTSTY